MEDGQPNVASQRPRHSPHLSHRGRHHISHQLRKPGERRKVFRERAGETTVTQLLVVPNLETKLHHGCVCIGENIVPAGSGALHGFRHPLGVWECIPCG